MKVRELMNTDLVKCKGDDTLNEATRLMWENDCGFVIVTDPESGELQGVLTDRDVCMAAYTKGQPLGQIRVDGVMNRTLATASPDEDLQKVHDLMRQHQIRRVAVTDRKKAVGVVSLNDMALAAGGKSKALENVGQTLAAICRHREEAANL